MRQLDSDEKSILLGHIKQINERLKVVGSDEDRREIFETLEDGICPECGGIIEGRECHCWNDE